MMARWLCLILLALPAHAIAAPHGSVRLCRDTELVEPAQRQFDNTDIRLPTNLLLDDFGTVDNPDCCGTRKWPLTIITQKPTELPPHMRCVTVPAIISPLSCVRSVAPSDNRDLEIVGVTSGDGNDDPNAPPLPGGFEQIHATIAKEFK